VRFHESSIRGHTSKVALTRTKAAPRQKKLPPKRGPKHTGTFTTLDRPKAEKGKAVKLHRREFLQCALAGLPTIAFARNAWSQAYPVRPVQIVAGFPPGSHADIYARLIGKALSERFGTSFIVENRTGAAGSLAAESVARAEPDGHTLLLTNPADALDMSLYDNLRFNYLNDIRPIASLGRGTAVVVVNPSFPAKTFPEFIGYAKGSKGKISVGSAGIGSISHLCWALLTMRAEVEMQHVPYRGESLALTDLLGGQVHAVFPTLPSAIEQIRAGKLRALAVTSTTRVPSLPDVPTVGEFVPGFEVTTFAGLGVPRNTPDAIVEKLNSEVNISLAVPALKQRVAELGDATSASSPDEFRRYVVEYADKWAKVIRAAGIKL
jgi:tripartite-type tricarboxylate transporter receptor subunit TctC